MERLTHQEQEVMLLIWELKSGVVKDIISKMNPKPPYTTVASVVKNLEKKGYIGSTKHGNVYEYFPIIKESTYKKKYFSGLVKDYFDNSYKEMVSFLAKEKRISPEELHEIIKMIEDK